VKNVKEKFQSITFKKFRLFSIGSRNHNQKTRKRHVVQARQLAMFFAKKFTKASLANIGSQIETEITQQYCMPVKPLII
jgi:chromosomal replication initiator protein